MAETYVILSFLYGIGAFIGICVALFAEVGRVRALADGTVDSHERTYLKRLGYGLWISVLIMVVANPLMAYVEYEGALPVQHVFLASFWFSNTLLVFILVDLWLMAKSYLPLPLGGAVSLASYAFIALLFFFGSSGFDYFGLLILYALAVFVARGILEYAHILTRKYVPSDTPVDMAP